MNVVVLDRVLQSARRRTREPATKHIACVPQALKAIQFRDMCAHGKIALYYVEQSPHMFRPWIEPLFQLGYP